jgi:hypothetical protein
VTVHPLEDAPDVVEQAVLGGALAVGAELAPAPARPVERAVPVAVPAGPSVQQQQQQQRSAECAAYWPSSSEPGYDHPRGVLPMDPLRLVRITILKGELSPGIAKG